EAAGSRGRFAAGAMDAMAQALEACRRADGRRDRQRSDEALRSACTALGALDAGAICALSVPLRAPWNFRSSRSRTSVGDPADGSCDARSDLSRGAGGIAEGRGLAGAHGWRPGGGCWEV